MVMYATPSDLASYLQHDVDTATATLVLELASELFANAAHTRFEHTDAVFQTAGGPFCELSLPFFPINSITAVKIAGVAVTDYTLIGQILYRITRWGGYVYPPPLVEVDLNHGHATSGDDVKAVVLDTAAQAFTLPVGAVSSEQIDDYTVKYAVNLGGVKLTPAAQELARVYMGPLVA